MTKRLLVVAALLLVFPSVSWSAGETDSYTASIAPSAVQPLASKSYTLTLANSATSPDAPQQAVVTVPLGFSVDGATVSASASASGSACSPAAWTASLNDAATEIDASGPALCPSATLTIQFAATAPATQGSFTWTTQLRRGSVVFALSGADAAVAVDGSPPPAPTLTQSPAQASNSATATFAFSDDDGSATFACRLDGDDFSVCTNPKTYAGLADGPHTFAVKAIDSAGNESAATQYSWTVDTVAPPQPSIDTAPTVLANARSASFAFSDPAGGVGFLCRIDGASFGACTSPASYSGLPDGSHTFDVRAVDAAGNTSAVASRTWVVDATAPVVTFAARPAPAARSAAATFAFATNEGSTFSCKLDAGSAAPCTSPKTYDALPDGVHTFSVRAVDKAGNASDTSYRWTVDTTPPDRVSKLAAAVRYRSLRLSWRTPATADFDHVTVLESTSARGPLGASVYSGTATSFSLRRFQNGNYARFTVISYDRAGNASRAATIAVSPAALLRSPRDGSVVARPPLLSWQPAARATYYNVQLYRGARKVLSVWPSSPQLQLHRQWTYQGRQRLGRGTYRWYVWPGFGARSRAAYGQLLGVGSFRVR